MAAAAAAAPEGWGSPGAVGRQPCCCCTAVRLACCTSRCRPARCSDVSSQHPTSAATSLLAAAATLRHQPVAAHRHCPTAVERTCDRPAHVPGRRVFYRTVLGYAGFCSFRPLPSAHTPPWAFMPLSCALLLLLVCTVSRLSTCPADVSLPDHPFTTPLAAPYQCTSHALTPPLPPLATMHFPRASLTSQPAHTAHLPILLSLFVSLAAPPTVHTLCNLTDCMAHRHQPPASPCAPPQMLSPGSPCKSLAYIPTHYHPTQRGTGVWRVAAVPGTAAPCVAKMGRRGDWL